MKKKILVILLTLAIQIPVLADSYIDKQLKESKKNTKYSSVKKHTTKYELPKKSINDLKDPKLIQLSNIPLVDEETYKAKLSADETTYNAKVIPTLKKNLKTVNIQPDDVDFYNIYRISERLIRANNLDYTNWRIAIRKSEDEANAASTAANFVWINTALYDSVYNNQDALAFVIAHEMAHHILGHEQRSAELIYRLNRLALPLKNSDAVSSAGASVAVTIQKKRLLAEYRSMEYMADVEAALLLTRAGFNMDNAMYALNFLNALPNVKTLNDTHPQPKKRIESMMENRTTFTNVWVNEGKYNIINSNVLTCKKSSDRVSIVINKNPNAKTYYTPESLETKLTRVAYVNYINGNMEKAIRYFKKLADINENYVQYLYISYANEYLYTENKNKKYLKSAYEYAKKAEELNPSNKYTQEQVANLSTQLSSLQ